jgi:ATP-dependent Clp protease ATP-binding subunit ClpA
LSDNQAERNYDLNRAAELKYGNLMVLQQQLSRAEASLAARHGSGSSMLREEVTAADISEVISKWTGIPVQVHTDSLTLSLNAVRHCSLGPQVVPFGMSRAPFERASLLEALQNALTPSASR